MGAWKLLTVEKSYTGKIITCDPGAVRFLHLRCSTSAAKYGRTSSHPVPVPIFVPSQAHCFGLLLRVQTQTVL